MEIVFFFILYHYMYKAFKYIYYFVLLLLPVFKKGILFKQLGKVPTKRTFLHVSGVSTSFFPHPCFSMLYVDRAKSITLSRMPKYTF